MAFSCMEGYDANEEMKNLNQVNPICQWWIGREHCCGGVSFSNFEAHS